MIALIDYGAGNLRSVYNALQAAGASNVEVARDAETIRRADRIILPGVGAFAAAMAGLKAIPESIVALEQRVRGDAVPFLGICVGMQILADVGEEHGDRPGLGWIKGRVRHLSDSANMGVKAATTRIPHIGWNDIIPTAPHPVITAGVGYFLHSYHFVAGEEGDILATSDYGGSSDGRAPMTAAVARDMIIGVQFHPEKSQHYGIKFLQHFLAWRP